MKLQYTIEDGHGERTKVQNVKSHEDAQDHRRAILQATRETSPGATVTFEIR